MNKVQEGQFGKYFLYSLIVFFSISSLVYYIYFFDDFVAHSEFKGITLLVTLIFTSVFFIFYTIDFIKDENI